MFTFAWPWAFLLLPLIWLIQRCSRTPKQASDIMLRVPFYARVQDLDHFSKTSTLFPGYARAWLSICAWCLLILACANPQWLGDSLSIGQDGRNIMLALDLSPSMSIPDLQHQQNAINRLQTVKEVAADFIEKRQGDKLGLILFGSKAYLQTPLTFDHHTLRQMLEDATIGLAGDHTAIGDAIGLAIKKFNSESVKSRILILLTDGGNNSGNIDPIEAARLAKNNQIKIYTIGIGASQMAVNGIFGSQLINPSADLDENMLKQISSLTQGQYFRAQDKETLVNILTAINELEPVSSKDKLARPITLLFYWPLSLVLMLCSILFFPKQNKDQSKW